MPNYIMFWLAKAIAPIIIIAVIYVIDIIIIALGNRR